MSIWVLRQKYLVTEFRNGSVYSTKAAGYEWFRLADAPIPGKLDSNNVMWSTPPSSYKGKIITYSSTKPDAPKS